MTENNYPRKNRNGEVGNDRRIRDRRRDQTIDRIVKEQEEISRIVEEEIAKGAEVEALSASAVPQASVADIKQEIRDNIDEDKTELPEKTRRKKRRAKRRSEGLTTDADNNVVAIADAVKDTDTITPDSGVKGETELEADKESIDSDDEDKSANKE